MLLVVFCIKDLVPADMEVAEERSPAMTDSSEGEVDQRIIFIEMMILVILMIWVIVESEGELDVTNTIGMILNPTNNLKNTIGHDAHDD